MSDLVLFYDEFCCSLWLFIGLSLNEATPEERAVASSRSRQNIWEINGIYLVALELHTPVRLSRYGPDTTHYRAITPSGIDNDSILVQRNAPTPDPDLRHIAYKICISQISRHLQQRRCLGKVPLNTSAIVVVQASCHHCSSVPSFSRREKAFELLSILHHEK